jgi:CheY-like chemotaxis protein
MRTRARVDAAYLRGGALPTTDGGRTGRPARLAADGIRVPRSLSWCAATVITAATKRWIDLVGGDRPIVLNGRDAMGAEGPLRISAREGGPDQHGISTRSGRFVCVSVEDQGEGMDERTLRRATEPFFTTKGVGKGTGLGLSMVHGLAEQSGGKLILKSKPGFGTLAELWLPAADDPSTVAPKIESANDQFTGSLSVLVVDDDPLVLSNTVAMLEDLGHRVTTASSADDAFGQLRTERFDLLLTDHAMPRMTGAQLIREAEMPIRTWA